MLRSWKKELLICLVVLDKPSVILVGYSGHAFVVCDSALENGWHVEGYLEQKPKLLNPFDLNYLGFEGELDSFEGKKLLLGMGDNNIRQRIYLELKGKGASFPVLLDGSAFVSDKAQLGSGTFVARGATINVLSGIGFGCIVNTGACVDHECQLGDFVHVAPNAVLCGGVKVGSRTFIGANSVVKEGIEIGDDVVIGAGSVVLVDVPSGQKIVGNPGKEMRL